MIRLVPTVLSGLLLAAHFLRDGQILLTVLCLLLPLLLIGRRQVQVRILQAAFVLGSLEWLRTLLVAVDLRWATGQPWIRLAFIIGGVCLFTLATAWWLRRWAGVDEFVTPDTPDQTDDAAIDSD